MRHGVTHGARAPTAQGRPAPDDERPLRDGVNPCEGGFGFLLEVRGTAPGRSTRPQPLQRQKTPRGCTAAIARRAPTARSLRWARTLSRRASSASLFSAPNYSARWRASLARLGRHEEGSCAFFFLISGSHKFATGYPLLPLPSPSLCFDSDGGDSGPRRLPATGDQPTLTPIRISSAGSKHRPDRRLRVRTFPAPVSSARTLTPTPRAAAARAPEDAAPGPARPEWPLAEAPGLRCAHEPRGAAAARFDRGPLAVLAVWIARTALTLPHF